MKSLIQYYNTGNIELIESCLPNTNSSQVLVRSLYSVISAGTEKSLVNLAKKSLLAKAKSRPDLVKRVLDNTKKEGLVNTYKKVKSKLDTPIPLGYSCSGIIESVGSLVNEFCVGDFVACGGAGYANHAEYNLIPKNLCVKIPISSNLNNFLPGEQAAFATVGAIALQGIRQAELTLGERVCVIGLGLLGQLTLQLCKANGCQVIGADIDHTKISLALDLGADQVVHSDDLKSNVADFTQGHGVDAVIITAAAKGNKLVQLAGEICRLKGRVVAVGLFGIDIPREIYYKKELEFKMSMSYGPGRYDVEYEERGHDYPFAYVRWTEQRNMQAFLELMAEGKIDVDSLITHRFPFEKSLDAYNLILNGTEPYLGVVLEYSHKEEPPRISLTSSKELLPKNIGLGVIGAGNFAKGILLPRFAKQKKISFRGIVTAKGMSARTVGEQFGFEYCAGDHSKILADDKISAIVVATRHNLHGPLVVEAIKAGRHVFVEKPLCLNIEELQQICEACGASEVLPVVMVGFNRRFSPHIQKIHSQVIGRTLPLMANYRVNAGFIPKDVWVHDPVEGGGRIIGEICHFVDTLRFLTGSSVRTVQAACIQTDDSTQVNRDSLSVILTYADGSVGTIVYHALGHADYPKEKLEVASGGVVYEMSDYRSLEVYGRKVKLKGHQDKGFDAEVAAFVSAVSETGISPIPLNELVETTVVTFAIHHALNTGCLVHMKDFMAESRLPVLEHVKH